MPSLRSWYELFRQAALALAHRRFPTLKGAVFGDGPERGAMEKMAADMGMWPERVSFLGQRDDVPTLLRQADMLCSDHEGFPNVVLEGMAAGLLAITTPAGDTGVAVQDGVTGFVVSFDDTEGMAQRMTRLAESPELHHRLGEAGRIHG